MTDRRRASGVTARETEVLALVAGHLTNSQIAEQLSVSVRTVETHVSSLMRKLQAPDRRTLARQVAQGAVVEAAGAAGGLAPSRWPAALTGFVGRDEERLVLRRAIAAHRMVSVTGPGGVGKTRLALEVVRDVATSRHGGGWFVDLVQVTDPQMVVGAVAAAIGVTEQQGTSLEEAVTAALAGSDAVILLDNCEHLIEAVRTCAELLLASCPQLHLVATSRAPLSAAFEWVYPVPGLSVTVEGGDAVTLFLDRARAAGADGALDRRQVATLCHALDGMALAIELAAARYPTLGLDGLMLSLDQPLRLLTSETGAAGRHRSLRHTIAWSHQLLTAADRDLLSAVSVFASWFDTDAARAVAVPSLDRAEIAQGLARLARHSLLVVTPGQPTRYRALETIRQYGAEELDGTGSRDAIHDRHRRWCQGGLARLATEERDEPWCQRLDRLSADASAAIVWAAHRGQDAEAGELAERLAELLFLRGRPAEAQRRYEQAAQHGAHGLEQARLLRLAAGAAAARMVGNDTLRLRRAASEAAVSAGDRAGAADDLAWILIYIARVPGIIAVLPDAGEIERTLAEARALAAGSAPAQAAVAVATAAALADEGGSLKEARRALRLAREAGAPLLENAALDTVCALELARGRLGVALEEIRRRGDALEPIPLDASVGFELNDYLLMGSEVHLAAGNLAGAAAYADRLAGLACYRDQEHLATARRIKVDAMAGDLDAAVQRGERFLAAWERAGRPVATNLGTTTYAVAMVHGLLGHDDRRRQWIDITAYLIRDRASLTGCATGWAPTLDAMVALEQGRPGEALERLTADIDDRIWERWSGALWRSWYAALWAEAAVLARHPEAGERVGRAADVCGENPVAAAIVQRAADLAGGRWSALAGHAGTFAGLGCAYQERRTAQLAARAG